MQKPPNSNSTAINPTDPNPPKVSIVTPSYNQGNYIEETIRSILLQDYQNLEYIIIDGKSTDNTVDIIRKYEQQLAYWVSEPDDGQYDAINKGFSKSTGEIMAWLNSDDKYTPWAFSIVADIFSTFPQIEWLTTAYNLSWDQEGRAVRCRHQGGYNSHAFYKGAYLSGVDQYSRGWIQQESTFWRRSLWDKAGGNIDPTLKMAGDFELWSKFFRHSDLYVVTTPLGGFRSHDAQKTSNYMKTYIEEAENILKRDGARYPYGKIESSVRKVLTNILGYRAISPDRLPPWIFSTLNTLPLLYPVKQCVWSSKGWQIRDAYIV